MYRSVILRTRTGIFKYFVAIQFNALCLIFLLIHSKTLIQTISLQIHYYTKQIQSPQKLWLNVHLYSNELFRKNILISWELSCNVY